MILIFYRVGLKGCRVGICQELSLAQVTGWHELLVTTIVLMAPPSGWYH